MYAIIHEHFDPILSNFPMLQDIEFYRSAFVIYDDSAYKTTPDNKNEIEDELLE